MDARTARRSGEGGNPVDLQPRRPTPKRLPLVLACLVAVLGLLFAGSPALAAAAPVIEKFTVPVDQVAPAHHDCINEPVHWTGSYSVTITSVQDASGAWHRSLTYVQRLTGVGLETGQRYLQIGTYHEIVLDSPVVRVYVFPDTYLEISAGGDGNYLAHSVRLQVNDTEQELGFLNCVG